MHECPPPPPTQVPSLPVPDPLPRHSLQSTTLVCLREHQGSPSCLPVLDAATKGLPPPEVVGYLKTMTLEEAVDTYCL